MKLASRFSNSPSNPVPEIFGILAFIPNMFSIKDLQIDIRLAAFFRFDNSSWRIAKFTEVILFSPIRPELLEQHINFYSRVIHIIGLPCNNGHFSRIFRLKKAVRGASGLSQKS